MDIFTITPFNPLWFLLMAGVAVMSWLLWLIFRKRAERVRRGLVIGICALVMVLYLLEKYWLSLDAEYLLTQSGGRFNVLDELPLHLCNVNMLIIPFALLLKRRMLLVFCCLSAPLGAFMALASPIAVFSESSILLPRNIGYYSSHSLLIVAGVSLFTLRLCRPKFRDLPLAIGIMLIMLVAAHLINTAFRLGGISSGTNYFFTYGPDGIAVLEILWRLIPIPLVYELPLLPVAVAYGLLVTTLIKILHR
ncbi:MAG: YwaF family protein [Coriobacteriales bacterium]|nr:YwaF family protein [Coriobacteriales bacterium]